jgi:hypothetical protein
MGANVSPVTRVKCAFIWIAASWSLLAICGCGPEAVDNLPRRPVSGKVTLDGVPLAKGTISFTPSAGSPTPAMVSIEEGSYSIPTAQGLVAGSYRVSILGADNSEPAEKFGDLPGKAGHDQAEAADSKQRAERFGDKRAKARALTQSIPAQYNSATTLAVEVKDDAPNRFDFDLSSAPTPKK